MDKFTIFLNNYVKNYLSKTKYLFWGCVFGIELMSKSLLVECIDFLIFNQCVGNYYILKDIATKMNLDNLKIYVNRALYVNFDLKSRINMVNKMNCDYLYNEYTNYLNLVWNSDKYMTITDMNSGLVLASTPVIQTDGSKKPTGIGKDARRVWLPEHWRKRNKILLSDRKIDAYEYKGYVKREIDDEKCVEPKLYPLAVDSAFIDYFGEPCILSTFSYL